MLDTDILRTFIAVLPAMVANATPVIFGGGAKISIPLFGKNKTIRGFVSGVFAGLFTGVVLYFITQGIFFGKLWVMIGLLQGIGAMTGDLLGSYIKRRIKIKEGDEFFIVDQLGFMIFAIVFTNHIISLNVKQIIAVLIITFFLHKIMNVIAYLVKLKKNMH
ncbi:MAG: CDP-archaeol synthase [Candidatus Micrarchaeota archaeon]|nr:CDP-archaeol synthase [Candidatus Micrarchaeota archaeon]